MLEYNAKYGWNGLKMKGKAIYILTSIKNISNKA